MKAKRAKETIKCIRREDGSRAEGNREIINETTDFYRTLFTSNKVVQDKREERVRILQMLPKTMIDNDNKELVKLLEEEIKNILWSFFRTNPLDEMAFLWKW